MTVDLDTAEALVAHAREHAALAAETAATRAELEALARVVAQLVRLQPDAVRHAIAAELDQQQEVT
ncbi:MAG: hypothetical protein ACR2GX_06680 [Candidatus Dormibacteria bacterium]